MSCCADNVYRTHNITSSPNGDQAITSTRVFLIPELKRKKWYYHIRLILHSIVAMVIIFFLCSPT